MYCPNCGNKCEDDAKYCRKCGKALCDTDKVDNTTYEDHGDSADDIVYENHGDSIDDITCETHGEKKKFYSYYNWNFSSCNYSGRCTHIYF